MAESTGDWSTWFQGVSSDIASKWASKEFSPSFEQQQMQLAALGQNGYYIEGRPGASGTWAASQGGMSPTMLMVGAAAALLVVMLVLKD